MNEVKTKTNTISSGRQSNQKKAKTVYSYGKKSSALKALNAIFTEYLKFIESPHRQDSILKAVQYSLWLLSKFYRNTGAKRGVPHRISKSLLNLQAEISWARYLYRFFGLPAAINGVDLTKNIWTTGSNSKRLGQIMSWTMIAYYPLEHLSYLVWKAPGISWLPCASPTPVPTNDNATSCPNQNINGCLYSPTQLASKASAWSCRFWLAWLILDTVRCTLALQDIHHTTHSPATPKNATGTNHDVQQIETLKQELQTADLNNILIKSEHLQITRNILYMLPAINWSLPNWDTQPWLSSDAVNGLCWLEAIVGLYQGIRNFRKTQV